jgi:uncharacterized membrane protein YbhN (UPF0104 family)
VSGARRIARSGWARAGGVTVVAALAAALLWWRGPDWSAVWGAFHLVVWSWITLAIALNVVSTTLRALSWSLTIRQALPRELHPRLLHVFSAFGVGLLANAVVPGRIGELARVATLRRHLPGAPSGTSVALVGTVVAHRLFDLVPATLLVVWVLLAAEVPHWAVVGLLVTTGIGFALFALAWLSAKRQHRPLVRDGASSLRHLVSMARRGLTVLKAPLPLAGAVLLQCLGWLMQLFAVYATMQAFSLDVPLPAAGLVLCLVNVATIVPLWPGNVGLVQAAVALPLGNYGVAYAVGFAYGLVLQGIEIAVGVGLGLAALTREGISFAMLRRMPAAEEAAEDVLEEVRELVEELEEEEAAHEGAPLPR